jgi:hypothetical protein
MLIEIKGGSLREPNRTFRSALRPVNPNSSSSKRRPKHCEIRQTRLKRPSKASLKKGILKHTRCPPRGHEKKQNPRIVAQQPPQTMATSAPSPTTAANPVPAPTRPALLLGTLCEPVAVAVADVLALLLEVLDVEVEALLVDVDMPETEPVIEAEPETEADPDMEAAPPVSCTKGE